MLKYEDIKDLEHRELECKHDSAKSFYKKANVYNVDDYIYLTSYTTIVARYNLSTSKFEVYNTQSRTTKRHIVEFMKQLQLDYTKLNNYIV